MSRHSSKASGAPNTCPDRAVLGRPTLAAMMRGEWRASEVRLDGPESLCAEHPNVSVRAALARPTLCAEHAVVPVRAVLERPTLCAERAVVPVRAALERNTLCADAVVPVRAALERSTLCTEFALVAGGHQTAPMRCVNAIAASRGGSRPPT